MATEQTIVERWLAALSAVTAPIPGDHELATRIVATAALLAGEFPAEAFCRASVAYVAEVCEFFPTYAKAKATLSTWWREHRDETQPAAIAAPPDRLDAMDRLWVKYWHTRMDEGFARSGNPNETARSEERRVGKECW